MTNEKRLIWDEDAKRHLIALAVGHHTETLHIDMILNAILHHTPTVDAVEVVHGRWEDGICTMCGYPIPTDSKYDFIDNDDCLFCYHCGAKMKGENEDG